VRQSDGEGVDGRRTGRQQAGGVSGQGDVRQPCEWQPALARTSDGDDRSGLIDDVSLACGLKPKG
jgi:hypothetical protein